MAEPKIRRALLSVSDKQELVPLAKALADAGAELVATGNTANVIREAGLRVTPIEEISGSPEAFQGRMKTLSFPVCSGILYQRGDAKDEKDLQDLKIQPIDVVVVNFYPFEEAASKAGITESELIEKVDIGGPTLVRAAAKNFESVLVLTDPAQYTEVIKELRVYKQVSAGTRRKCAERAWERVVEYDEAIRGKLGQGKTLPLRYGENPHQAGRLELKGKSPIAWEAPLTAQAISYTNILDVSAAYGLASEFKHAFPEHTGVIIVKHANPCGVALVPKTQENSMERALELAWQGDSKSAFGGVLLFTDPLTPEVARALAPRFIELVAAPQGPDSEESLKILLEKRKNLKALKIREWSLDFPQEERIQVPGGVLVQAPDRGLKEKFEAVTKRKWEADREPLARFGVAVTRALKSNAVALVREISAGAPSEGVGYQLVGAGQGQPNRVDALERLLVPRAREILGESPEAWRDVVLVSDAFFPFKDAIDSISKAGIQSIVQPGGSIRDEEVIAACNESGISMVFTGTRHFRH